MRHATKIFFIVALGLFVAVRGLLSSCGARAPELVGSVVVACGHSCPATCGILVPRPEIEPASPALEGGFLTTGLQGKSQSCCYILKHVKIGMKMNKIKMYTISEVVFLCPTLGTTVLNNALGLGGHL